MLATVATTVAACRILRGKDVGREDVATFFRTWPRDEVGVGGFVVATGERSRFDDSTAANKLAGVKGAMVRRLPSLCS